MEEREQAEQALKRAEREKETILNSLVEHVIYEDATMKILWANQAACESAGLPFEELIGRHCYEIWPKRSTPCPDCPVVKAMETGQQQKVEKTTPDGRSWFIRGYPVLDANGDVTGAVEVTLEITERKKAEEKNRESEEKYRRQFEGALDAIFVADAETGIIIDCNRAASELVGREKSELVGKHQRILHPPEEIEAEFSRTFKQHLKEKEGQVLEDRVITKKGEIKDVAIKANVFELRGKKLIQGIFRDITEQKKMEEALRESVEKYRELINGMNDTAWVIDFDGNFIDVNEAAVKVLGYSREELLSMGILDIDFSLDPKEIKGLVKGMPSDEIQVFETAHTTKDGKTIPVEISSSLVTYQGKQAILSIARDITERKKIEAAVAYERDLLHALMDNIPDTIYFKDVASRFTRTNRAHAVGLKIKDPEEAIGKTDFDYYAEEFAREAYVDEQRIFKTGKPLVKKVEKVEWRDGKSRWASTTKVPIIDKNGRITGLVGISRDITEIKEMEERLRQYSERLEELVQKRTEELLESEKRYSVVVEEASDGVTIVQDGKIIFVNKKASEIAGYIRDELIGLSLEKLVDEKYHQLVKERYMRRMRGETVPATYEVEFIAKNDERVPVEVSATRIHYQGHPADLVIMRDIRERKRMEEQRLKLEKLAAIAELATIVGHDLRNPLQAIENATYYLNNELSRLPLSTPIPQKSMKMLQVLNDSVNYADKIIRALQDFSATKKPALKKTDINAIVREILSQVEAPENVELITELGHLPRIEADKDMIKRVFFNLALNGIQATGKGGRLKVSTKKTKEFVEVSFKDTGIGMSKENMKKLFTPFFTTKAKGMGMGLAICKKFVDAHDGTIAVESEEGKGTTLTVKLPIQQEKWR